MQKNATPSKTQADYIRRAGYNPDDYTVIRELNFTILIRHRSTGATEIVEKRP